MMAMMLLVMIINDDDDDNDDDDESDDDDDDDSDSDYIKPLIKIKIIINMQFQTLKDAGIKCSF